MYSHQARKQQLHRALRPQFDYRPILYLKPSPSLAVKMNIFLPTNIRFQIIQHLLHSAMTDITVTAGTEKVSANLSPGIIAARIKRLNLTKKCVKIPF